MNIPSPTSRRPSQRPQKTRSRSNETTTEHVSPKHELSKAEGNKSLATDLFQKGGSKERCMGLGVNGRSH